MMAAPITAPAAPTSAEGLAQNAAALKPGQTVDAFAADHFIGEPKLDGWRLLIHRAEDGVHTYSRAGKCQDGKLPAIEAEVEARFPAGTWLDGEAVAMRVESGAIVHDWNTVQSVLGSSPKKAAAKSGPISIMVFDLIAHGGTDARSLPFGKRRDLLERIFAEAKMEKLLLAPQLEPTEGSVDALLAQGFEGMVIKDRTAPYASGKRGQGWTKIKPSADEDVVIMGYKEGENGFTGLVGAVVFGQMKDGKLVERGRCSGMDMATRKAISKDRDGWLGEVIEISRWDIMESGKFRHPQMKRKRVDKAPDECAWSAA